ncbi:MAG: arginase family protein, partial [Candidatus Diapherotrites archaeon]|nr:arginase family protein [Candidatus Diapherotrites archaeon]
MKLISVASSQGSLDKNKGCELFPEKIFPEFSMEKDFVKVKENDNEETDEQIYLKSKEIFNEKEFPLFLGGDHSITYSEFKAFAEKNENAVLIVFDAHADCAQFFKPVSHEDMNKVLVEEKILKKENLLLIGVRKIYEIEEKWLKKNKIKQISSEEIHFSIENIKKELNEFLKNKKNVFVSIDCDVFSPELMPATGYLEENGLNEKEFFELLELILKTGKVKAMDLVEINP